MGCNQVCQYNTLAGCKVKERNGICPLSNSVTTKPMTNADRIRAMSDEELATFIYTATRACNNYECESCPIGDENCPELDKWLKQPAEEVH